MKLLLINSVYGYGSTGKICAQILKEHRNNGDEVRVAFGRGEIPKGEGSNFFKLTNKISFLKNVLKARLYDNEGLNAKHVTKKFVKWAENYNPDVVWIHNLHGYYINYPILFAWLKSKPNIQVKWTLHDCWAFTGHCAYFDMAHCEKWKHGCSDCPIKKNYPKAIVDRSVNNYVAKKEIFNDLGVNRMTLISPSEWLANHLKDSFLKTYKVEVVRNVIDTNIFKPTTSDFRVKYNLENKKIILGVAAVWDKRKGLEDFIKLSKLLDDKYKIVLIGLKKIKKIPKNILAIYGITDQIELAKWYSTADFFFNPSREDNYPTTLLEAMHCNLESYSYDSGGCSEISTYIVEDVKDFEEKLIKKHETY